MKTRNRVHRNGGTKAVVQQVPKYPGKCATVAHASGNRVGAFTAKEASALDWIAHQLGYDTPEEFESAAEDSIREAAEFRLAAGALRRTGNKDWLWSIAPTLAMTSAARGERPFDPTKHSPITAEFVQACAALYRTTGLLMQRMAEARHGEDASGTVVAELKRALHGAHDLNVQLFALFELLSRAGLLQSESEGAR